MKINLTPHNLNLYDENKNLIVTIPPSGTVARVVVRRVKTGELGGVPTFRTEYGAVENLPEPQENTTYIVSGMVRTHPDVRGRKDVYQPGELLRDSAGRPIGAIGLSR